MWPYCFKIPLKTLCIQALREKGVPFSQFPSNTKTFVIHCLVVVISHIYSPAIVALMKKKTVCSARSGKYFYCNIINTLLLILTWHLLGNRHKEELIDLRLDNLKHLYLYDFKESGYFIWICVKSRKISYTIGHSVPKFKAHCAKRQVTKEFSGGQNWPKICGQGNKLDFNSITILWYLQGHIL